MTDLSRRTVLQSAGAAGAAPALADAAAARFVSAPQLQAVLERYAGFGNKASGGPGDEACGTWLEGELRGLGYSCRRQGFRAPFFTPTETTLTCDAARAEIFPQALVTATSAEGIRAPLRRADAEGDLAGALALVLLPSKRWVSLVDRQVAQPLADASARGALAAVLVTNGPTGEAIKLNVTPHKPGYGGPIAILAPRQAAPFIAAAQAGETATLTIRGEGGRRPAWNLVGRLDRGASQTVVVSTPRSGWFGCVAERGSGLAVWLSLAEMLAKARAPFNVELLCTSGHEYEYMGGEAYLAEGGPPQPATTRLWTHIGASAAARDWHEIGPVLRPLPSADAQRVLTATADVIDRVRPAFRGLAGLEATYVADKTSAGGELTNVLDAGYRTAIGLYGGHRYFHTPADDLRCCSGELVEPVARAFRTAHSNVLASR